MDPRNEDTWTEYRIVGILVDSGERDEYPWLSGKNLVIKTYEAMTDKDGRRGGEIDSRYSEVFIEQSEVTREEATLLEEEVVEETEEEESE